MLEDIACVGTVSALDGGVDEVVELVVVDAPVVRAVGRAKNSVGDVGADRGLQPDHQPALVLRGDDKFPEGRSPYGLPKVRVVKIGKKPKKAAKTEEADDKKKK